MSLRNLKVLCAAAGLLALAAPAQSATVYQLSSVSITTSSAPGVYPFGSGALAGSTFTNTSTVIDDGAGNLTVNPVSIWLNGFGADMLLSFSGTTTLGGSSLIKTSETCSDGPNPADSTHLCDITDQRSFAGDWHTGLMADGVTEALTHIFSATVAGDILTLSFRTNRDASPVNDPDWLQLNFNYQVVPIPAAAWLVGGALGLMGFARRRMAA
jgi:opacity protein-like surface antigen